MGAASQEHVSRVLRHIVERLPDCPAVVFSRSGAVLLRNRAAVALFGTGEPVDPAARGPLVEVRHAGLGRLELHRQLLVDREARQTLLILTAVPGSPSEEKLRLLTTRGG